MTEERFVSDNQETHNERVHRLLSRLTLGRQVDGGRDTPYDRPVDTRSTMLTPQPNHQLAEEMV